MVLQPQHARESPGRTVSLGLGKSPRICIYKSPQGMLRLLASPGTILWESTTLWQNWEFLCNASPHMKKREGAISPVHYNLESEKWFKKERKWLGRAGSEWNSWGSFWHRLCGIPKAGRKHPNCNFLASLFCWVLPLGITVRVGTCVCSLQESSKRHWKPLYFWPQIHNFKLEI